MDASVLQAMSVEELEALIKAAHTALQVKRIRSARLREDMEKSARAAGLAKKDIEDLFV